MLLWLNASQRTELKARPEGGVKVIRVLLPQISRIEGLYANQLSFHTTVNAVRRIVKSFCYSVYSGAPKWAITLYAYASFLPESKTVSGNHRGLRVDSRSVSQKRDIVRL